MDCQDPEGKSRLSGSSRWLSDASSSRRHSLSILFPPSPQRDVADESESVSEAGDIGNRALNSGSGRSQFSLDNVAESGTIVSIQEETLLHLSPNAYIPPAVSEKVSPISVHGTHQSKDEGKVPWLLEYITCLFSLAVFGILGVLARYCLQKLFGPEVIGATSDESYMYLDLPSNMVGSFLMGWLGGVFKGDIMKISGHLAIGLTTGFLGSLTTFSGWNQKMLDLSVNGQWIFAILGIVLGLFLVAYSIIFGIETAKGFKYLYRQLNIRPLYHYASNKSEHPIVFMVLLLLMLGVLWGIFGTLTYEDFKAGGSTAQLSIACLVGPFGVWIRWLLARFNGQGLGRNGVAKWIPVGTLAANVLAACIMAALATLKKAVKSKNCDTVATGIQLGFLGCLSTVSTFVAEFHAMRESKQAWRAYAYAGMTFFMSFVLGTLVYSLPVWGMALHVHT